MKRYCFMVFLCLPVIAFTQAEPNAYEQLLQQIANRQNAFHQSYQRIDDSQKAAVLDEVRSYLLTCITDSIFSHWYGTPWDFEGHSRKPGQGTIACGYFVTHTLADAGFKIPRYKWAQAPSEVFIKKLAPDSLKRFFKRPISEIEAYLQIAGDGLYLVGLDMHTGFLVVQNDRIRFVHANYYQPEIGVMSEPIDSNNPLRDSRYRVIGKLLSDKMLIKWLNRQAYD